MATAHDARGKLPTEFQRQFGDVARAEARLNSLTLRHARGKSQLPATSKQRFPRRLSPGSLLRARGGRNRRDGWEGVKTNLSIKILAEEKV